MKMFYENRRNFTTSIFNEEFYNFKKHYQDFLNDADDFILCVKQKFNSPGMPNASIAFYRENGDVILDLNYRGPGDSFFDKRLIENFSNLKFKINYKEDLKKPVYEHLKIQFKDFNEPRRGDNDFLFFHLDKVIQDYMEEFEQNKSNMDKDQIQTRIDHLKELIATDSDDVWDDLLYENYVKYTILCDNYYQKKYRQALIQDINEAIYYLEKWLILAEIGDLKNTSSKRRM